MTINPTGALSKKFGNSINNLDTLNNPIYTLYPSLSQHAVLIVINSSSKYLQCSIYAQCAIINCTRQSTNNITVCICKQALIEINT